VTFAAANLVEGSSLRALGRFDLVFCRNVLIYFDDAARRTAAEHLFDALSPGGFLALGHSETMAPIDDRFLPRRFADAIVYQRPEAAS
jgi:chemotaxis protein methyltransferase CheR